MQPLVDKLVAMEQLVGESDRGGTEWLWDGYLARGNITLLTSQWKTGKTTLLAGLLRHLSRGEPFLGRACARGSAVVVSEESRAMWAERLKAIPVGPRVQLLSRPFLLRPTPDEWDGLVQSAADTAAAGQLDLFVVDPLASFLPGRSDCDPATLLTLLHPLRRLADRGAAVLVLHHPRKQASEEGCAARGSGALLAFVDVILELYPVGGLRSESRLRRLVARSRHPHTPAKLVFEWTPGTADFRPVEDQHARQFEDSWEVVRGILARRTAPATHRELMDDWPPELTRPPVSQLYHWLSRAADAGRVRRTGAGTKSDPYRFRLPREDDLPDLPDLPPLGDLSDLLPQFFRKRR